MNDPLEKPNVLAILRRVCARRDWRLFSYRELGITEADAVDQVIEVVCEWQRREGHRVVTDALLENGVTFVYCRALHRALDLKNTPVQNRACTEIGRYITPIATRYFRDTQEAQACANGVLLTVWQKHADLREPGTLLKWAGMITARDAFKLLSGKEAENQSLDAEEFGHLDERLDAQLADGSLLALDTLIQSDIERQIVVDSQLPVLEALIRKCLRSVAQQEVFIAIVLHDFTVSEVARALGITPNYVSVLKHHAKEGLGRCKALLAELGRDLASPARMAADAR